MIDLNALRVFERVATLRSFSAAARALGSPKSSVSRCIAELEAELGTRLFQRTHRTVALTESGTALLERCSELLVRVDETLDYVAGFARSPRGVLRISSGIGFGINILSQLLPAFLARYPEVDVSLDLSTQPVDLVAHNIDVAIRIGPLPRSELVARRLGAMTRYLCASPAYLARRGTPKTLAQLRDHDAIELPSSDGRPRTWTFTKPASAPQLVTPTVRIHVNEALTIHRLVLGGAGLGIVSGYVCSPDIAAGRLVRLLPDWQLPALDVSAVFPSHRELSPAVRAFVDFITSASQPGLTWQSDLLASAAAG